MFITQDVVEIASLLKEKPGAVIAYPTETFYGLGALISDHDAIERIIKIKGRDAAKGMIVIASDMEMARTVAEIDDTALTLLQRFWPGPLSAVLRAKEHIDAILAPDGKTAVRISPHPLALSLVRNSGPFTSTSANISGHPPAQTVEEVTAQNLAIDGILDGGSTPGGRPSTLVDLTQWPPVLLRDGAIPVETIVSAL